MRAETVIVAGEARGRVVALTEPLSFWGGFDAESGRIIDERHPQKGVDLKGAVVVMMTGRGSSSASSVLAEAVRRGTAPAAFILRSSDEILSTGVIVGEELYGRTVPILLVDAPTYTEVAAAAEVTLFPDGTLTLTP